MLMLGFLFFPCLPHLFFCGRLLVSAYANQLVNINAYSHSRSKSLRAGLRGQSRHRPPKRNSPAEIKTLRCSAIHSKKRNEAYLLNRLYFIATLLRGFGFFFGRTTSSNPSLRSALTSSYLIASGIVAVR